MIVARGSYGTKNHDDYAGGDPDHFGWEEFTLVTPEAKQEYLDAQWAGAAYSYEEAEEKGLKRVDHQSQWSWPNKDGKPDRDVYDIFQQELVQNDDVVIIGGSDGSGRPDEFDKLEVPLFAALQSSEGVKIRKDPGGWITVLSPYSYRHSGGIKFRIGDVEPKKSFSPELVDIKITDYCSAMCEFCYQGSTELGAHAKRSALDHSIEVLKDLDVMEVALGGGEPLDHPLLRQYTQDLKKAGIVVNVTTRKLKEVGPSRWERTDKYESISNFGVSIQSAKQVSKHSHLCYHVVLGAQPMSEVYNILLKAGNVLLLDFKTTGRGEAGPAYDYSNWLEVVRAVNTMRKIDPEEFSYNDWQVGIDTPLARKFEKELASNGISELTYETEEGKHSAYWDLVAGTFGPCSYEPERLLEVPKDGKADADWFRDAFKGW